MRQRKRPVSRGAHAEKIADFIRANPGKSYSQLARELRGRGIRISSTTLNTLAVQHGIRKGAVPSPKKKMAPILPKAIGLGPEGMKRLERFIGSAGLEPAERRFLSALLIERIPEKAVSERFGQSPMVTKNLLRQLAERIGLYEFIDSLERGQAEREGEGRW